MTLCSSVCTGVVHALSSLLESEHPFPITLLSSTGQSLALIARVTKTRLWVYLCSQAPTSIGQINHI
jgi:hypothetical protein